jgi:hypothetical protein
MAGIITAIFIFGHSAQAMTVSPVLYDYEVEPGGSRQGSIALSNDGNRPELFALEANNFVPFGEDGAQQYVEEETPTGLASWMTFDRPSILLQPGETAAFPFVVTVPKDAEPGGHYASIFFSRVPDATEGSGVGVGGAIGVLVLVNVTGDVHEEARIESFVVRGPRIHHRLPVYFDTRIRNLGSVHFRPRGELVIRNVFGRVVSRSSVNPKNSAVLPNSIRRVETAWARATEEGPGGFFAEIKNEWKHFAIGPYTASVSMVYGSKAWQLEGAEVSFWVIPWRLILVAFVGVLSLVLLGVGYHRMVAAAVLAKERKRNAAPKRGKKK